MAFSFDLIPDFLALLALFFLVSAGLLGIYWCLAMGLKRGLLATLCRLGWTAPLFLSFFPATVTAPLPRTVALRPVQILVDDSASMGGASPLGQVTPAARVRDLVAQIEGDCSRLGCIPKITRLSELSGEVNLGYTPLSSGLESWIYKVGADPWLLLSDGGDSYPTERWRQGLVGTGRAIGEGRPPRGLIVGFPQRAAHNMWIKVHDAAPFSFEERPLTFGATVHRSTGTGVERVQVQAVAGDRLLSSSNVQFDGGETEAHVTMTIPALPRGQHLLTIRALPIAGETTLWDNTASLQVEVLPNTVGVLHLLGSPSWDGRFVRRYLKSEPKYDLISFFILRDPWDSQLVSERELSLIPFPVERLFRDELSHFRVVIVQNFTLFQFLLPEYQENLVKFVQDGGGLLFIGGSRALSTADLMSSPLRAILPFDLEAGGRRPSMPLMDSDIMAEDSARSDVGPAYDPDVSFNVDMGRPTAQKRGLADIYEDWEDLAESLTQWKTGRGLHRMDRVKLKKETTVLLKAQVGRQEMPLAVASYPGQGRALWLFSDSFWRLAMTGGSDSSRQVYNRLMHSAMTWLMRQDLRKPLLAKALTFAVGRAEAPFFSVQLQGPATRYLELEGDWAFSICGVKVPKEDVRLTRGSETELELVAPLPAKMAGGERCLFQVAGSHPAFGSVKAEIAGVIPVLYTDKELDAAPHKLRDLAQLTGARLVIDGEPEVVVDGRQPLGTEEALGAWLGHATGQDGVSLPNRYKTLRDFYWVLSKPWFWLLLLLMPLEVVIRKWDQFFVAQRKAG